jgi:hypothetical protein
MAFDALSDSRQHYFNSSTTHQANRIVPPLYVLMICGLVSPMPALGLNDHAKSRLSWLYDPTDSRFQVVELNTRPRDHESDILPIELLAHYSMVQ